MTTTNILYDPNKVTAELSYDADEMAPAFPYAIVREHEKAQQGAALNAEKSGANGAKVTKEAVASEFVAAVATAVANVQIKNATISGGSSSVANVSTVAKGTSVFAESAVPLRDLGQEQVPYPTETLGAFANVVKALAYKVKVPEAMAGSSVLTALAFCAQGFGNVLMRDGRTIPTSLYCLTVADSGDRKSSVDNIVSEPIKNMEKEFYKQYCIDYSEYEDAKKAHERRPKKEQELFPFEMEAPKDPSMMAENVTAEGLFRKLKECRPSLAMFFDEGGTLFGGQSFNKENALKSITFFSKLWDGSPLDKVRSGEGFSRLYDRRVSMHLMIQPTIAEGVFANQMLQGQGFLPRFLISWPQSLKGSRSYEEYNIREDVYVQHFSQTCERMLRIPLQVDDITGGIIFNNLTLSAEAHAKWVKSHDTIEKLLSPDGFLLIAAANASKCAEQAIRIAGVLTLSENPNARVITGDTMKNALLLAGWYLKEALRLRQNGEIEAPILRAEMLLKWLQRKEIKQFSVRHAVQYGPRALRKSKLIKEAIGILEEHRQIQRGLGEALIGGSYTKEFWEVSPCA